MIQLKVVSIDMEATQIKQTVQMFRSNNRMWLKSIQMQVILYLIT